MRLINLLTARYRFRYNTVMGYPEYHSRRAVTDGWQPVDDRVVNGLTMEARLSGLDAWDKDIKRYVQSNMVKPFNPILDFLGRAEAAWDGHTDHIGLLARTVPCEVPQWEDWFRKWLLYMVAQWLGKTRQYGNSVAPLLISEQGNNKSTFCRRLLPDCLQWGYNDNLLISEKKATLQAMSQFLLINLDEFNQISPQIQEGFLKNVIQLARVKVKRPYGKHVEDFPRLASFIATTNEHRKPPFHRHRTDRRHRRVAAHRLRGPLRPGRYAHQPGRALLVQRPGGQGDHGPQLPVPGEVTGRTVFS